MSQAKRGDLLFYGPGGSQHVAIYLGGGQDAGGLGQRGQGHRQPGADGRHCSRTRPDHRILSVGLSSEPEQTRATSTDSEVPGIVDGRAAPPAAHDRVFAKNNVGGSSMTSPSGPPQARPRRATPRNPPAATPPPAELTGPAVRGAHPGTGDLRGQAHHRRPGPAGRADAGRPAGQGARAARRCARCRQDAGGGDLRQGGRRHVRTHPVHPRPGAHRHRRHPHLPPGQGGVRHRARPGGGQLPARRRDQPCARQGAVRAARGHGRAQDLDRRQDVPAARTRSW